MRQALLGMCGSPCNAVASGSHDVDASVSPSDSHCQQANSLPQSPCYSPYPKVASNNFQDSQESSILCIHCGLKGHKASVCVAMQSSHPERPIIISWKLKHIESTVGRHICLFFNINHS